MNISLIGSGRVGAALAGQILKLGHEVTLAARDPNSERVRAAVAAHPGLGVRDPLSAVAGAEVVFVVTPFAAVEAALTAAGDLGGKIVVDCTNPVGPQFRHALGSQQSGTEWMQALIPNSRVVKAFNCYGFENFLNNHYPGYGDLQPLMPIAGNDPSAKAVIAGLCRDLGWQVLDVGDARMSLHLEHMALLWITMVRGHGASSGFVWAMLQR